MTRRTVEFHARDNGEGGVCFMVIDITSQRVIAVDMEPSEAIDVSLSIASAAQDALCRRGAE